MDKQENGEIKPIMLNDYAEELEIGKKVIICKLPNGNLQVKEQDKILKQLSKLEKYINEIIEYNSYDECGEFKDNDIWSMKLD